METLPSCCGSKMKKSLELGRFVEALCKKCDDVVYVKKKNDLKGPEMIDD